MENKKYEVKVKLDSSAWHDSNYKLIQAGELENLALSSKGFLNLWRGVDKTYQNVFVINGFENALELNRKLNNLSYVSEVTLFKEGSSPREGYIEVKRNNS